MPPTEARPPEVLATQLAAYTHLEKPSRQLVAEGQTAVELAELLAEREQFADATQVVAHLLPPREAVWWACQSARQAAPAEPPPEWTAALEATEKWVAEMTDESRRSAERYAQEAGLNTAPGCAALAAFHSGGSIAPPEMQAVESAPYASSQLAAGSITISALTPQPAEAPEKYRRFLQQGIELYRSTLAPA